MARVLLKRGGGGRNRVSGGCGESRQGPGGLKGLGKKGPAKAGTGGLLWLAPSFLPWKWETGRWDDIWTCSVGFVPRHAEKAG